MNCPNCGSSLQQVTFQGVTVDECDHCQGVWFDRDELRRAKDSTDNDLRWLDFDLFGPHVSSPAPKSSGRACPACGSPLETLEYEHSKVLVDACTNDHGVWLDRGEFEKLVSYLEGVVCRIDLKDYGRSAFEELKEVVAGPESLVSELRDFLAVWHLLGLRFAVEHPQAVEALSQLSRRM